MITQGPVEDQLKTLLVKYTCFIELIKQAEEIYQTRCEHKIKCEAYRAFFYFFATSLVNSIIKEHECEILFTTGHLNYLKSHVWRENVNILSAFCNVKMDVIT